MRGGGTTHKGLVFDVDNGSVAPNQALQAVTTIAQVVAVPAVTFNADTLGFCKLVSLPELFLSLIYFTFSVVIGIVGPATLDVTNFFEFCKVVLIGIAFLMLWMGVDLTQRVLLSQKGVGAAQKAETKQDHVQTNP